VENGEGFGEGTNVEPTGDRVGLAVFSPFLEVGKMLVLWLLMSNSRCLRYVLRNCFDCFGVVGGANRDAGIGVGGVLGDDWKIGGLAWGGGGGMLVYKSLLRV
jgi:hypothetical protein